MHVMLVLTVASVLKRVDILFNYPQSIFDGIIDNSEQ